MKNRIDYFKKQAERAPAIASYTELLMIDILIAIYEKLGEQSK